jgi:hypothetical protein
MSTPQDLSPSKAFQACSPSCHKIHSSLHSKVSALQSELAALKSRYDSLLLVKERASARYRADYKKWKDFKVWLFEGHQQDKEARKGMKAEERQKHILAGRIRKVRRLEELRLGSDEADEDTVAGEYFCGSTGCGLDLGPKFPMSASQK